MNPEIKQISEAYINMLQEQIHQSEKDPRWELYSENPDKKYTCHHMRRSQIKPGEHQFMHKLGDKTIFSHSKYYPDEMKKEINEETAEAYVSMLEGRYNPTPTISAETHSWGKLKKINVGHSFSIPLHPEHHEKIESLGDGDSHRFTDETKTRWNVKREGDNLHFDDSRGNKTSTSLAYLKSK